MPKRKQDTPRILVNPRTGRRLVPTPQMLRRTDLVPADIEEVTITPQAAEETPAESEDPLEPVQTIRIGHALVDIESATRKELSDYAERHFQAALNPRHKHAELVAHVKTLILEHGDPHAESEPWAPSPQT